MANLVINDPSVVALLRQNITVSATAATLTNAFFASAINSIYSKQANVTYISGVDFSQVGTTITLNTGTFTAGDTVIAYL
jgi:hypothetical protein